MNYMVIIIQIGIILKDKSFKTYSHQKKIKNPTNNTSEIYNIAKQLVKECWNNEGIRLVGVSLSKFTDVLNHQISIFDDTENKEKDQQLDKIIDKLKITYGKDIIGIASQKRM